MTSPDLNGASRPVTKTDAARYVKVMNIDDVLREQRRLKEMLGLPGVASALDQARRSSALASRAASLVPKSVLDQVSTSRSIVEQARLGSPTNPQGPDAMGLAIASGLREREALISGAAAGFARAPRGDLLSDRVAALWDGSARELAGLGRLRGVAQLEGLATGGLAAAAVRSQLGAISRAAHWAGGLQTHGQELASLLGGSDALHAQIGRLTKAASAIAGPDGPMESSRRLGALDQATFLKMSAFGGSLDVLGPGAGLGGMAFDSLLGVWRMRADLPPGFWRNPSTRARTYHDAHVDPGLVDADASDVVEVLVESGVVEGERTRSGVRAVVEVGSMRLAVTTARPRHGAFQVIDAFEVELRAFLTRKLQAREAAAGGNPARWFERRVPGDVVRKAKDVRRDAYRAGEGPQALVNFTNLGDLIAVVTRKDNWEEVFAPVFGDRDGFIVDLRRLNENRRTIMHARPIDGVRLTEVMLTARRLLAAMAREGPADEGWDEDD